MKTAIISSLALSLTLILAPPAFAKTKKKPSSKAATGIYCAQGPDSVFIGVSQLKPNQRRGLRIGQKAKVNLAGFGPVDCVVR
jgi:hypothetical protein